MFPSDTINGYELGSQAKAAVDAAFAKAAQSEDAADRERKEAIALKQRLDNVSVNAVVHELSGPWACGKPTPNSGHRDTDWGFNLEQEAKKVCGTKKYVITTGDIRNGEQCGKGAVGYVCIVVPPDL